MWGLQLSETIGFAFRRRYGLAPRDPRYLELTSAEIEIDYWAHAHIDDPKLREEEFNPDFEADVAEMGSDLPAMPPDPGDFETIHDDVLG